MVEDEYKRFLVIKCVELISSRKEISNAADSSWLQSVQPCKLVEVFWQAHCLRTIKNSNDCNTLFGEILPFSGPHDNIDESSSLSTKNAILFQFEQYFLTDNLLCYDNCSVSNEDCSAASHDLKTTRQRLFDANLDLHELDDMISWIQHASMSDCECDDTCCELCCVCANEFSFSDESDDEE